MKKIRMSSDWLRVALLPSEISRSMAWKTKKLASRTFVLLLFINIHIFDYPDPRLSGLFHVVPTSPDNRGSCSADVWDEGKA